LDALTEFSESYRECEALRTFVAGNFPADEAWLGVAAQSLGAVPLEMFRAIGTYAHAQRMRLHTHVSTLAAENAACVEEYGRTPIALLGECGLIDKRFTAVGAIHLAEDEIRLLGNARASVCVCPISEQNLGLGTAAVGKLAAAGAGIALGTDRQVQIDLMANARLLEYALRTGDSTHGDGADPAATWWHAATVAGARSLGSTTGALEVGRPADFFTVNLFDPAVAGAAPENLLAGIVLGLERRAIREVWVGARPIISGGRHAFQGPIVGRFVELQKRLWADVSA
ncbi:MAG: amidohydrolase family protein, partial [Opitutus sp.]